MFWPLCRFYRTDAEWDAILSQALDEGRVEFRPTPIGDGLWCFVGDCRVWINNWPYAYGSPHDPVRMDVLPSRRTASRLRQKEKAAVANKRREEMNAVMRAARADGKTQ